MDVGLALAIIGVIPSLLAFGALMFYIFSGHRFFRFRWKEPLHIVLSTDDQLEHHLSRTGVHYKPAVTTLGNLEAAVAMAVAIGGLNSRKRYAINLSRHVKGFKGTMHGDLVLIGGPVKNRISYIFLESLKKRHPELKISYHDRGPADETVHGGRGIDRSDVVEEAKANAKLPYMRLGEHIEEYEPKQQDDDPNYPEADVALAVLWVNPFSDVKRRGVLCAGFTDSGTAAAMSYVLSGTARARWKEIRRDRRLRRRFGLRGWWRSWPCFAALLKVSLSSDRAVSVTEVAFAPLADPTLPLFTPSFEGGLSRDPTAHESSGAVDRTAVRTT